MLDWVHRITIGFQKEWAEVKRVALKESVFSKTAIYRARKDLTQMNIIEFRRDANGRLLVCLNPGLHCLSAELLGVLPAPEWPAESQDRDNSVPETGHTSPRNGTRSAAEIGAERSRIRTLTESRFGPKETPSERTD